MSTPTSIDEVEWVEMQANAHVLDWDLNERRQANLKDPTIRELVRAGLLTIVDEETAKLLPPPNTSSGSGGCGCGKR